MMNLENTKVYTTDEDVIRKYGELCGVDFSTLILYGKASSYHFGKFSERSYGASRDDCGFSWYKEITPEQINALYDEKFGIKTETPEESEALDAIAQVDSEEWNGEGLPPVGIECEILFKDYPQKGFGLFNVLAYHGGAVWVQYVGPLANNGKCYTAECSTLEFRKPETPQQREERERLEAAYDLYVSWQNGNELSLDDWSNYPSDVSDWLRIVDKTGYRKQSK